MPSSIQVFNQAISSFKTLQTDLVKIQSKIGADSKAETFSELGSDINLVQTFSANLSRADRFVQTINNVNRKVDEQFNLIGQIIDTAINFKQSLTIENSINGSVNNLQSIANTSLLNIEGALNSRDGNGFIFAGSKTNEQPVSNLVSKSNYVNEVLTANYYSGDEFKAAAQISSSMTLEYGIVASDSAFQKLIGAINIAKEEELGSGNYLVAGEMLDDAIAELNNMRASIGDNARILEQTLEFQVKAQFTLRQKLEETNGPDIVQLSIESANAQAILQASFQMFSRISNLKLSDFL